MLFRVLHGNISKLAKMISCGHRDTVHVLTIIKKELVPNCKHPKKMRDRTSDRQVYCMNCNFDIDS